MDEAAIRVFVWGARRLNYTIQRDELMNDDLPDGCSSFW